MPKKFITSALPYVNNQPHLGNIVGSVLGADVYNRYCKKKGEETIFICGTDEYGTATEMEALRLRIHPSEVVSKNRVLHKRVYDWMKCDFDHFGETSCPEHTEIVQSLFKKCHSNGYFEEKEIQQFYCKKCDQFLADRFVEGICEFCKYDSARGDQCDKCGKCLKISDLSSPRCALCSTPPIFKSSNHLFLRLDLLQSKIKQAMDPKKARWSENAANIYKEWLEKDLTSRCMTRSLKYKWGVPVPLKGFEDKVFYVWFDAVIGYLTFLSQVKADWEKWLMDAEIVQFMGKDNVFFHAFIFPAILLASDNNSKTVDVINSTEYLTFNKNKFSKSRNLGIFGMDLVEKDLGPSSIWRFYLIKRRPETKDSDFNVEEFMNIVKADLIGNIGNLCQRVLKYIAKNCNAKVEISEIDEEDQKLVDEVNVLFSEYKEQMDKICLREGLERAVEISSCINKYIQNLQGRKEKMARGFQIGYSGIVFLANILEPFIPEICEEMHRMCKTENSSLPTEFTIIRNAEISTEIETLFKPLSPAQLENLNSYNLPKEETITTDKKASKKETKV